MSYKTITINDQLLLIKEKIEVNEQNKDFNFINLLLHHVYHHNQQMHMPYRFLETKIQSKIYAFRKEKIFSVENNLHAFA